MTYATEFPDMPAIDVPAIVLGDGWTDASWRNDLAPMFIHDASGVAVWVNWADTALREDASVPRFMVVALEWDGTTWVHHSKGDVPLFECEPVYTLTASLPNFTVPRALAHAFVLGVTECLSDDELDTVCERNSTPSYAAACATHDFTDANMVMADAFEKVMGRPIMPADGPMADADMALWNAAWDIAKRERLTAGAF